MELKQSTSFSMTKDTIKAGRIQGTACCPVSANENDLIYLCHVDYAAACYAQHLYSIATKQFKYQSGYSR